MKKVRITILFMTLFLGMFFFMPAKVLANTPDGTAADWFNHISQFDAVFAYCEPVGEAWGLEFGLLIVEEPAHEVEGWYFDYDVFDTSSSDLNYFEPSLKSSLRLWATLMYGGQPHDDIDEFLEDEFGEDFDGYLYWNFEQGYWQIESTELDYYIQRVDELEDEISSLEDEISSLEDEISSLEDEISSLEDEISSLEDEISSLEDEISTLEDEISSLENEIQQLENALDLEYDRGYNDGYEIGYSEGLLVENNDVDITKWFVPLIVIIIVVGIIEPIIILKKRG